VKIYRKQNVWDAALDRMRYLFDEFDEVAVGFSGGKDSTVVFNLAMMVAKEKNKLPLKVIFVDQEAEWTMTTDYIREIMSGEDVEPMWFQIPIKILNAASTIESWLSCWGEGEEWIREKEPNSIKENIYGTDRFHGIFGAIAKHHFKGKKFCYLSGVRTEESPIRLVGLTQGITYKYITWGKVLDKKKGHYTFYPLYDWSYTDIWKAIHDNKWEYNEVYDYQYRYGVSINDMRVSNLHHETAVNSLFYLQEIDGELYKKLTKRISGIDTAGKLNFDDFFVKELPIMFKDWQEYRDFLMEKLVTDEDFRKKLNRFITIFEETFEGNRKHLEKSAKKVIQSIVSNDLECTKISNYNKAFCGIYRKDKRLKKAYDKSKG
jgi:predicted phosphoadenosine phosphosulfate sulfurtransferase